VVLLLLLRAYITILGIDASATHTISSSGCYCCCSFSHCLGSAAAAVGEPAILLLQLLLQPTAAHCCLGCKSSASCFLQLLKQCLMQVL
jgi:hypothetical protein